MAAVRELFFALILAALLGGCGVNRPSILSEGVKPPPVKPEPGSSATYLVGSFPVVGGTQVRLDDLRDKPVVLVFASDTCDICLGEAESFRNSLKDPALPPSNIHLLTTMVGAIPKDVAEWKKANAIPWPVGWDESLSLYKKYCGGASVPCTLVQMPEKGIVFRHIGETHLDEIVKVTGPWEAL